MLIYERQQSGLPKHFKNRLTRDGLPRKLIELADVNLEPFFGGGLF
jgi:hypothetical protein